jgi:hypothetical protein
MFGTMRTEICKVIGNVIYQSLIIINNYFLGLEAFSLYHVYIKRQMQNAADGKTGQYRNCRSLESTFGNRVPPV